MPSHVKKENTEKNQVKMIKHGAITQSLQSKYSYGTHSKDCNGNSKQHQINPSN